MRQLIYWEINPVGCESHRVAFGIIKNKRGSCNQIVNKNFLISGSLGAAGPKQVLNSLTRDSIKAKEFHGGGGGGGEKQEIIDKI